MARPRNTESSVNAARAAGSAAAPSRRTAAPRKRTAAKQTSEIPSQTEELVASDVTSEPVAASVVEAVVTEYTPTHEEISALAYTYWIERGYTDGDAEQDWLRAEAELRRRR